MAESHETKPNLTKIHLVNHRMFRLSRQPTIKLDKIDENESHQTVALREALPPPSLPASLPKMRQCHSYHSPAWNHNGFLRQTQQKEQEKEDIPPSKMLELRSCVSAPLMLAVQHSVGFERSKAMDKTTASAARKYYELIVNDETEYHHKKKQIYDDLVIGHKTELKTNGEELKEAKEFELKYKIGVDSQCIQHATGSVLTVGRYTENDICTGDSDESVSRIQFFILLIGTSLIVLDGWSFMGTQTMKVNDSNHNMLHSMPDKRYVLRFNRNDIIHLKVGQDINLIINPKECVVCMNHARVIRNECGHYALCTDCFNRILFSRTAKCPVCRAELKRKKDMQHTLCSTASYCPY